MSESVLNAIGNTPLVEIKSANPLRGIRIFAKLESTNPGGSIKDRIALAMVEDAERRGLLREGATLIEPTSGNTGIGLAMVAAAKGYGFIAVMPENASVERRQVMQAFGARVILVKKSDWRDAAIKFTQKLAAEKGYVMLNQYENSANISAHYNGTGKEIVQQMQGMKIDAFVAGIGTGGTIMGAGRRIKEAHSKALIVGAEAKPATEIQGLKSLREGYIPRIFDEKKLDRIVQLDDEEAFETARALAEKEGIFAGISSGAALNAAISVGRELGAGNIVTIFPDGGDKYLSTKLLKANE
ncbi:MAG: cysteine synthase family protein [Candidatus Diapherotrites archaeon]|nr:cysteine synthase family protein [Candidatus Diapherotrites archaeon]